MWSPRRARVTRPVGSHSRSRPSWHHCPVSRHEEDRASRIRAYNGRIRRVIWRASSSNVSETPGSSSSGTRREAGSGGRSPTRAGCEPSSRKSNQAYAAIEALRIPVVAAVQGQVVGGHYELLLRADVVLAAGAASFTWVESGSGMTRLAGGVQRLA
ncbi:enoyl-CoA hydratase-related protein [Streptomyces sp. NPDC048290]|uniref:enoyl-CoA hydratase-related protein n=1 Tax=Streptomyces sp. NPDC048290 TaxID=3155811 RepID=UPI00343EB146